jgi:hypothetical protein
MFNWFCERPPAGCAERSFPGAKQLIRFGLKLLNGDLSAGVGLQVGVELIEFLHARFTIGGCRDSGTELLKMYAYLIEGKAASAVGALNSRQCRHE